jgi:sodium/bile acid cotransporter 7
MKASLRKISGSKLGIAIVALIIAIVCAYIFLVPGSLTDEQKRIKIEKMYSEYKKKFPDVPDIDPQQAMPLWESQKVVFVDVRESDEQFVSKLPGAVTAEAFLENPDKYKDYIKIGYCTISYRSGKLAQKIRNEGIAMYNLRGGLLSWVHNGGKVYSGTKETNRIHVYGRLWDLGPDRYEAVW